MTHMGKCCSVTYLRFWRHYPKIFWICFNMLTPLFHWQRWVRLNGLIFYLKNYLLMALEKLRKHFLNRFKCFSFLFVLYVNHKKTVGERQNNSFYKKYPIGWSKLKIREKIWGRLNFFGGDRLCTSAIFCSRPLWAFLKIRTLKHLLSRLQAKFKIGLEVVFLGLQRV